MQNRPYNNALYFDRNSVIVFVWAKETSVSVFIILPFLIDIQWHAFNQSYFKVVETALNFQDAMEFCRAEKGDLASVASEEEQTFLFKNFLENSKTINSFYCIKFCVL